MVLELQKKCSKTPSLFKQSLRAPIEFWSWGVRAIKLFGVDGVQLQSHTKHILSWKPCITKNSLKKMMILNIVENKIVRQSEDSDIIKN
jgi:hypothetical protein